MDRKELNFEDSMQRLEDIVRKLEDEDIPLEESINLYEEGVKIGKKCRNILDEADKRIKKLSKSSLDDSKSEVKDE
ncbi:MAG TPA: exodeoxyribonuclease VII small subunit [Candidatus Krumholzibacteriaceae bacterium]|nr:exodeoxyribonuclease VII small subunit [Candidatus Krumholzibacteriaceae bacterium]